MQAEVQFSELVALENAPGPRSSHAVAVVGSLAFVFGGELEPRVPIDNLLWRFDISTCSWSVVSAKGTLPAPRVGATMTAAGESIFFFGGRSKDSNELDEFFEFNTASSEWTQIKHDGPSPPGRSYHAMTADAGGNNIFIFGGCGVGGRLNDLWCYSIAHKTWTALSPYGKEASPAPRGGPGLVVASGSVWVVFGFNGKEMSDVHRFDLSTHKWEDVTVAIKGEKAPAPRSVFGAVAISDRYILGYGGEVDPSDKGHMGAGNFIADAFILDLSTLRWLKPGGGTGRSPGARGWYAFAPVSTDGMLVYGGNSDSNDRLQDLWLVKLLGV